jgi:hypothetical protein
MDQLREHFPDSLKPFAHLMETYRVVFRLALRLNRSHLGEPRSLASVTDEVAEVAHAADKMLLFTQRLQKLSFKQGDALITEPAPATSLLVFSVLDPILS